MAQIDYDKNKKKLLTLFSSAIVVMLIMSFIAMPYIFERFDCASDIGKLTCGEATFAKYFALLAIPLLAFLVIVLMLIIPASEKEKTAIKTNLSKINRMNYYLVGFFLIIHPVSFSFYLMPKQIFLDYSNYIQTFIYVLMSLGLFQIANMAGKMEKSLLSGWPTPWNLKSDLAWEKSQRFMGFSLTGVAIITMISAFIWPLFDMLMLAPTVAMLGMIIAYIGCFIVSYYVYQQEQHNKKHAPKE